MRYTAASLCLLALGCASAVAVDVPAGTYTNPTSNLGGGDSSAGYNLLGDATFGWQTGTLNGSINVNSFTLTVNTGGGNRITLNGALSGTGALIWLGGGVNQYSYLGGTAANTLSGTLTVSVGVLVLAKPAGVAAVAGNIVVGGGANPAILLWQNSNQVANSAGVSLVGTAGAQLNFQGYSETLGTVSLQTDADIYLGNGSAIVHFADSSGVTWTASNQLIIHQWDGSLSGGGTEQVFFGNSASGLTGTQVQHVGFMNPAGLAPGLYRAAILATGEVVPSGSPVVAVNPPYDLSPAAQAARAAIYASAGRSNLVAAGTPLANGTQMSFFGDSITWLANGAAPAPANANTANPINNFNANGFYYNLIGRALVQSGFTNVTLFNHGINGGGVREIEDGTDHSATPPTPLQPSLATLITSDNANVAVIFIGINDVWWRGTTTNQFLASLSNCVQAVEQFDAHPVVVTMALHGERPDGSNGDDPKIEQYCAITRAVAQAAGATLVDLRSACIAYLQNTNYQIRLDGSFSVLMDHGILTYDGVHPTDTGNALFADKIAQGIHDALAVANNGTPIWIESIASTASGALEITFKDYRSVSRAFVLQSANLPSSNAFAVVNSALFTNLGLNRFKVKSSPASVSGFYRIAAFSGGVPGGPVITSQPAAVAGLLGATATFTVSACGANLHYQWCLNGSDLAGQTASTLTLTAVSNADAGVYTVRVFNNSGAVTSAGATLTAINPNAPPAPTGLTATALSPNVIALSWNPSTNSVGVVGYYVYCGGAYLATVSATNYTDTGLAAATLYTYTVAAFDSAGAVSAASTAASATTFMPPGVLAAESFDYLAGTNLSGLNGGMGWAGAWSVSQASATPAVMLPGNLGSYPGLVYGGNQLEFWTSGNGNTHETLDRAFATPIADQGQTIWFGMMVAACNAKDTTTWTITGLSTNATGTNGASLFQLAANGSKPASFKFGATTLFTGDANFTPHLVLVRIQMSGDTNAETVTAYLDPNLSTAPSLWSGVTNASLYANSGLTGFSYGGARNGTSITNVQVYLDEIRFGTTWQTAVGQPAP